MNCVCTIQHAGTSTGDLLWFKAYMQFTDISGEVLKAHTFAEIVDGVVTAIADGYTTPWAEWL